MTSSDLVIRPAAEADIPAITAIFAHYVEHALANWELDPPDEAEMAARFTRLTTAGYPYLVAADPTTGAILGYAYASSFHAQTGWRYTVENSIYVAASAHRRGIGRALLSRLIDHCAALGFRQMIAGISRPGGEGSVAFHEALGFSLVGTFPNVGWKAGHWLTACYYQRALGEGRTTKPE